MNISSNRSHNEVDYQDLLAEHQNAKKKLGSKVEALLLVSEDLAKCQAERDRARDTCDFLEQRVNDLETLLKSLKEERIRKDNATCEERDNLLSMLQSARRENRLLLEENKTMRQQVKETRGDIKVLRQKLAQQQLQDYYTPTDDLYLVSNSRHSSETSSSDTVVSVSRWNGEKTCESSLEEIEKLTEQHQQLERDLRSVLCEKEELVSENESYKTKCDRLSQEMSYMMNGDERRVVTDIDGVIAENRYLKAQLQSAQEETGLARAALNRYRAMVERRKKQTTSGVTSGPGSIVSSVATSSTATHSHSGILTVVTPKQIRQLLGETIGPLETQTDYRALAGALFDAVSDKNLALTHQRKANKILGLRVTELETRLRTLESKSPIKMTTPPTDPDSAKIRSSEPEFSDQKIKKDKLDIPST